MIFIGIEDIPGNITLLTFTLMASHIDFFSAT
jgi:hypothetical protein